MSSPDPADHAQPTPDDIGYRTAVQRIDAVRRKPRQTKLDLSDLGLTRFPPEIASLTALQSLHLSGNQIAAIPPEIASLTALQMLPLSNNRIAVIPPEIATLTALQALHLSGNRVAVIPPEIATLTALQALYLSNNPIAKIPPEIAGLTALQTLDLSGNQIAKIPPEIASLTSLQSLDLSGNQIAVIPPEIASLTALQSLDLSRNQIAKIPPEIATLTALQELYLDGNPLPDPYPKLMAGGQPRATINVLSYLRRELDPDTLADVPPPDEDEQPPPEPDEEEDAEEPESAVLTQRPAAFRFGLRNGRIDALPETARASDAEAAADLYAEAVAKAQALRNRLAQTNSDKRAQDSVSRLLDALGSSLADVRPGLLLSRSRSIEADRNAFNTPKARRELFPDAIAMMDDLSLTVGDLLAVYPAVREIEAERLALAIQADAGTARAIAKDTSAIAEAAAESPAATPAATSALKAQDADIAAARNTTVRSRLLADKLLVVRNFASEAVRVAQAGGQAAAAGLKRARRELGELGGASWRQLKDNLPDGIGIAARLGPTLLVAAIAGPIGNLAKLSAAFKTLDRAMRNMSRGRKAKKKPAPRAKPKSKAAKKTKSATPKRSA